MLKPRYLTTFCLLSIFSLVSEPDVTCVGPASWHNETVRTWLQEDTNVPKHIVTRAALFWSKKEQLHVPSWRPVYHVLSDLINEHDLKIGCEIGVAFGTQSIAVLENSRIEKWYGCDPYHVYSDPAFKKVSQPEWDILHAMVKRRLAAYGRRSHLIRKPSASAVEEFQDATFCIVYIDGLHTYEAVKQDLTFWYPKVRGGGFIVGDDYSKEFPGLKKAVNEFVKKHGLTLTFATKRTFVIRKPTEK